MKLQNRRVQRRMQTRVRQRLRADAGLRARYRRARSADRNWAEIVASTIGLLMALGLFGVAVPIGLAQSSKPPRGDVDAALVVMSVGYFGLSWVLANWLASLLRNPPAACASLPFSDGDVAGLCWRKTAGASLLFAGPALVFHFQFCIVQGFDIGESAAVLVLWLLQWGVCLALAITFVALFPRQLCVAPACATAVYLGGMISLAVLPRNPAVRDQVDMGAVGAVVYAVLPTGWLDGILRWGVMQGAHQTWWLLLPAAFFMLLLSPMLGAVKRTYAVKELAFDGTSTTEVVFPDGSAWSRNTGWQRVAAKLFEGLRSLFHPESERGELPGRLGRETARERVLGRSFLDELDWAESGWIERVYASTLSQRQRAIAETLVGRAPRWTERWQVVAAVTAVVVALSLVAGGLRPAGVVRWWMLAMAVWVIVLGAFALRWVDAWPGLRWRASTGHISPAAAHVPLHRRELDHVVMRLAVIRGLFLLPLTVGLCVAVSWMYGGGLRPGIRWGAQLAFAYVAIHHWMFLVYATTYTDTRSLVRQCGAGLVFVLLILLCGISLGLLFAAPAMFPGVSNWVATGAAFMLVASGWVANRWDAFQVHHAPIDLVSTDPRAQQSRRGLR